MKTELNIPDADGFYEALSTAHDGLSEGQGQLFHASLALLLANQIGDQALLHECIRAARDSVCAPDSTPPKR
ncbi:DUF2783 domain-containing protein [Massilia niastensis]|uniref:DUF2783 domain-containing protein n=1 Tax=Massilia niastensis TaxID=544911 RepID=UPI0003766FD9|nr:DUF2783 domain-containing protein [Massilia niastensis]